MGNGSPGELYWLGKASDYLSADESSRVPSTSYPRGMSCAGFSARYHASGGELHDHGI